MGKTARFSWLFILFVVLVTSFQNCSQTGYVQKTGDPSVQSPIGTPAISDTTAPNLSTPVTDPSSPVVEVTPIFDNSSQTTKYDVTILPKSNYICEPFGNSAGDLGENQAGLKAELAYIDSSLNLSVGQKNSYLAVDYFSGQDSFTKVDSTIFLSQINVPSRTFSEGFKVSSNSFLTDKQNSLLIEWFALKIQSLLKLSDKDEEGYYELATISDDGSALYIQESDSLTKLIDNDGGHATQMKCASKLINLKKDSKIPFVYFYNQGPRFEIANVLIWRKILNPDQYIPHSLCNEKSIENFWNPKDSKPGPYWETLQNDGFKILSASNFELPNSQVNPCSTQNTNLIKLFKFSDIISGSTQMTVNFSQPANIKAQLFKVVDNQKTLLKEYTNFYSQLRDQVSLEINELTPNQEYAIEFLIQTQDKNVRFLNEIHFNLNEKK